jgi:ribosomal protein S6--L-glutamate ligase
VKVWLPLTSAVPGVKVQAPVPSAWAVPIWVQEYIEEAKGRDIRCLVVGDEVVAAIERQAKEGDFRSNLHRGGVARVANITEREREIALKAAHTLGLDIAGVDILRAHRGPLVMEVNASPGLEGIEKTTGIDIAGKMIAWIERQATPGFCLKMGG